MKTLIATLLIGVAGATGVIHHDRSSVPPRPIPRALCDRPPALRLVRFEDGSARVECGRRLLLRIAVPW
jgi:hypothetical protein